MENYINSPGYKEAFTANAEEIKSFEPGQPAFHWNVVNQIRRYIRDSAGEAQGWRQQITTLVAEKSWERLGYESLPALLKDHLNLTPEEFAEQVTLHAGPDIADLVTPHLGKSYIYQNEQERKRAKVDALADRQAAAAPELAIRLRAKDLITEADMRFLGKLNSDEAHQETLQLIQDRIVEIKQPTTSGETERRRYRAEVKNIIQAVAPTPKTKSSVVRFPDNANKALAIIQEHLSDEEQDKLRLMMCNGVKPEQFKPEPTKRDQGCYRSPNHNVLPSREEAFNAVMALNEGELATGKCAFVLTNQQGAFNTFQGNVRKKIADGGEGIVEGNGWKFRKLNPEEMNARGLHDKKPSFMVIEYGEE